MTGSLVDSGAPRCVESSRRLPGFTLVDVRYPAGLQLRPHAHETDFVCLVTAGECSLNYPGRSFQLAPGALFYQRAGEEHSGSFGPSGGTIFHLEVGPGWFDGFLESRCATGEIEGYEAAGLAAQLRCDPALEDDREAESLGLELLAAVARRPLSERQRPAWLPRALELLREACADPLTVSDLARALGRHPCHVARAFRMTTGMTVGRYLQRLRVCRAAALLRSKEQPLSEIALECGFSDQSHMGRLFRRFTGCTPAEYRTRFGRRRRHAWE